MIRNTFINTGELVRQAQEAGLRPGRRRDQVTDMEELSPGVWKLTIRDPYIARTSLPGRFVNLYSDDPLTILPRPLGVCRVEGDLVEFVFAVVGTGTEELSRLRPGDGVDVLGPLGRGFDLRSAGEYLLVGGGLGVPPLISAAQVLRDREDTKTTALFGYRRDRFADRLTAPLVDDLVSIEDAEGDVITLLDAWEADRTPCTAADMAAGGRGTALAAEPAGPGPSCGVRILTCGPTPMMKAVAGWARPRGIPVQCSLEERMGCGYGTCVACVVDTVDGRLKVCKDGPVFSADRLEWSDR